MSQSPLSPSEDGRDETGRFIEGNRHGRGNPNAKAAAAWRQALVDAATPERVRAVMDRLFQAAEAGEPWAVKEVMDRLIGKPTQAIVTEDENGNRGPIASLTINLVEWRPPRVTMGIPGADKAIQAEIDAEAQKALPDPNLNVPDSGKG